MVRPFNQTMAMKMASRLEEYFADEAGDNLRSIVKYDLDGAEIVYIRDDVAKQYPDEGVKRVIDEARMDSFAAPIYEDNFSEDHGELTCIVQCFENVIEMNFILDDMVGAAVGLDVEAMQASHGLVAEARRIVAEERC